MRKVFLASLVIWFSINGLLASHSRFGIFGKSHFNRGFARHSFLPFRHFGGGFHFSGNRSFHRRGFYGGPRYGPYYGPGYPPYYRPQVRNYTYSGPPSSYFYANSYRAGAYGGYPNAVYELQKLPDWASYGSATGEVVQANYGDLVFKVEPGNALVYLNGKLIGSARSFSNDRDRYTLLDGDYTIRIVLPGFEPFEADLQVVPNRTHYLDIELKPVQ